MNSRKMMLFISNCLLLLISGCIQLSLRPDLRTNEERWEAQRQIKNEKNKSHFEKFADTLMIGLDMRGSSPSNIFNPHSGSEREWYNEISMFFGGISQDEFMKEWQKNKMHRHFKNWLIENDYVRIDQNNFNIPKRKKRNLTKDDKFKILNQAKKLYLEMEKR